ncbi:hypothetical protein CNR22_08160 [Sphingobacteriaceae bacterium]|nr:hypothetical protein CNR22_08160 [Sphingobacteriaceae bacterium]
MKKFTILAACFSLLSLASCKKDRTCDCTTTYTSSSGNTTTSTDKVILLESKKSDAKSLCQKTTWTSVGNSGSTSTTVQDCKLN